MSGLSGLGPLELAVLETMEELGAGAARPHVKCHRIVQTVEAALGYGRSYSYLVICDLARPWTARLSLVDFHGNFGGGRYPPPPPMYTEARLSSVGALALRAEREELGPVPIGLINGTLYQDGYRPPLDPIHLLDVLDRMANDPSVGDDEIQRLIGPPSFRQRCEIAGDIAGLYRGEEVVLVLRPRYEAVERGGRHVIIARDFPPGLWAPDLVESLRWHASEEAWLDWHRRSGRAVGFDRLRLSAVRNLTSGLIDHTNDVVEISLEDGADPAEVLAALRTGYNEETADYSEPEPDLREVVPLDLGSSLPDTLRAWIQFSGGVTSGLHELRRILTRT